jgi:type IV secretion system protein VirB4
MDQERATLTENARLITREIQREGFTARIETVNTMEAWLGSLLGHPVPNVRRPLIHTANLADMLPLAGVWTGREENPCPFYPQPAPPLLYAATAGATPFRMNLHVRDVGHTLVFGPTGAGKSTLLCTVALQALRYRGVTICAFDKGGACARSQMPVTAAITTSLRKAAALRFARSRSSIARPI